MFHFSHFMASVGIFFTGIFGGGHASTTPAMTHHGTGRQGSSQSSNWEASTTAGSRMGMAMMRNGIFGTVTATNGSFITVEGRQGTSTASTTFSVDASNAKIRKGSATSTASVSDISIGDRIIVEGTVTNGTDVDATSIFDGIMRMPMNGMGGMRGGPAGGQADTNGQFHAGAGVNIKY